MIRIVIENLLYMGISAGIISLLMLTAAGVCRGRFNAKWHLTGWLIAMVTLLVPVYLVFGTADLRLWIGQQDSRTAQYRIVITNTMDRSIGDIVSGRESSQMKTGTDVNPASALNANTNQPTKNAAAVTSDSTAVKASAVPAASILPNQVSISLRDAVFTVWLGVALLMGSRKFFRYFSFRRRMLRNSQISDGRWADVLPEGMKIKVILREANIPSPIVFGVFHPIVVVPAHARKKDAVHFALLHEMQHIERRDLLVKFLAETAAVIHWFNPFAWLIRNKVTIYSENACDESVAAQLSNDDRKGYAMAILDFMDDSAVPEPNYPPTLMSFSGGTENLKNRIKSIMKYKKMKRHVLILSVCMMLTVSMIGTMAASNLAFSGNDSATKTAPNDAGAADLEKANEKAALDAVNTASDHDPVITVKVPAADRITEAYARLNEGDISGAWKSIEDDYAQPDGPSLLRDIYQAIEDEDDGISGIGTVRGNTTGNIVNGGLSATAGDWIYYSQNGLWKYNIGTGENIRLLESTSSFPIRNINVIGEWVYYTCYSSDIYQDNCLFRMDISGGKAERIYDGNCQSVSIVLDRIYIVLQKENTEKSVGVFTMQGGFVKELVGKIYGNFSNISVLGGWVYYGTDAGDSMGTLNRVSTDGTKTEEMADGTFMSSVIVSDGWIYYASAKSAGAKTDICRQRPDGSDNATLLEGMNLNHFNVSDSTLFYESNWNALGGHPMMKSLDGGKGVKISDTVYCEDISLVGNELANVYVACDVVYSEADFQAYLSGMEIS